jgi:hypothetical protein
MLVLTMFTVAGQEQNRSQTTGEPNGIVWRGRSLDEKLAYLLEVRDGVIAAFNSQAAVSLPSCPSVN